MSKETQPFCPKCGQPIGGRGLLEAEITGLKSLHKRELDLRLECEKVRDELRAERDLLQQALDTAEEDLIVLGQRLLNQAKSGMKM